MARRCSPEYEKFREEVLAKVREGYWGSDLVRLFPKIPRTTMISWAQRYLEPGEIPSEENRVRLSRITSEPTKSKKPEKPNVRVKVSTSNRIPEEAIVVETSVEDAATYFNYRINYDEAMADIDRTRGWVQSVLMKLISEAQTPVTQIRAIDTLTKVLSDRERHLRAERAIIESIQASQDDARALWEYLQKNEGVSLEVSYE